MRCFCKYVQITLRSQGNFEPSLPPHTKMPDLGGTSTKRDPTHQLNSTGQIYHLHNVCGESLAGSCGTEHFYVSAEHEREKVEASPFFPHEGEKHSLPPGG